jgi:hypothetical protein
VIDWADLTNTLHYKTVEQPRNRAQRWWQRHGHPWVCWWEAWCRARQERKERRVAITLHEEALFRAAAEKIETGFLAWLKEEHWTEFRNDVTEQAAATERAKAELAAEYEKRDEQRADALAASKRQAQLDCDQELEAMLAKETSRLQREAEGEIEGLRDDLRDAQRRMAAAEESLVGLWRQLLPEGQRVYLFDSGITTLDLVALNAILQRHQLVVAYTKSETSTRLVKVRTADNAWQAGTRFWLEAAEPPAKRSSGGLVNPADYR